VVNTEPCGAPNQINNPFKSRRRNQNIRKTNSTGFQSSHVLQDDAERGGRAVRAEVGDDVAVVEVLEQVDLQQQRAHGVLADALKGNLFDGYHLSVLLVDRLVHLAVCAAAQLLTDEVLVLQHARRSLGAAAAVPSRGRQVVGVARAARRVVGRRVRVLRLVCPMGSARAGPLHLSARTMSTGAFAAGGRQPRLRGGGGEPMALMMRLPRRPRRQLSRGAELPLFLLRHCVAHGHSLHLCMPPAEALLLLLAAPALSVAQCSRLGQSPPNIFAVGCRALLARITQRSSSHTAG